MNHRNQFIGQVCHIEAAEPGGERFNSSKLDDDRRSYDNLLLLCYPHHVETDDVATFSVERLRGIKLTHEQRFERDPFKIDENLLYKVAVEMEEYWNHLGEQHAHHHIAPNMSLPIDSTADYTSLASSAKELLGALWEHRSYLAQSQSSLVDDALKLFDSLGLPEPDLEAHAAEFRRLELRDWEIVNLGIPNALSRLSIILQQMELRHLEQQMMLNPTDRVARLRLDELKEQFLTTATTAGLV